VLVGGRLLEPAEVGEIALAGLDGVRGVRGAFSGAVKTLTFSVDVMTPGSSSWQGADTTIAPWDLRRAREDPGPHTGPPPAGILVRPTTAATRPCLPGATERFPAAERSRYADEAVRYERVHLARELHDTVAHWLTAVVIQARAGQVRSLTQQESVAATFADIMTAAGRADEELTRAATLLGRTALRLTHSSVSRGPFRCAMLNPGERRTSRGDRHSRLRCRGPWRRHPDRRESTGRGARPWGRRRACRLGLSDRSARVTHLAALDQCRMSPWERVDPSCGSPRLRHAVPT